MLRRVQQQRRASRRHTFRPRFTFLNFVCLVLGLVALAYTPSIYQRFFQKAVQTDCDWLQKPPLVCAHGGDSLRAPANTHAAYQLALDAGVECIEIDASRTRDGVLVALHNRDLQKMTKHGGVQVGDFTANQIKQLDPIIGFSQEFPDQRVPTVEDAIQSVHQSLKQIIIDAKVGPPWFEERLPAQLISMVMKTGCKNCILWAKEDNVVKELIRLSGKTKTGYIVLNDTLTGKVSELLRFPGAEVVGIYYGLVTRKLVNYVHRSRKKVYAWTVNTADSMMDMLKASVDAIITNDPKLLQQVMQLQKQQCVLDGFTAF